MYGLFTLLGIVVSLLVARNLRAMDTSPPTPAEQSVTGAARIAAVMGAVVGAHAVHIVPTALGWLSEPPLGNVEVHGAQALYGRSILGGLLGGWMAVEWTKHRLHSTSSLAPRLAAPLAIGLCFGRIGCLLTGCCGGAEYHGLLAVQDQWGTERFPVQLAEILFHGTAFVVLYVRARRKEANELDLVGYFALYGMLRFMLETVRWYEPLALGLTWYQWVSLALFVPAATVFARRLHKRSWVTPGEIR